MVLMGCSEPDLDGQYTSYLGRLENTLGENAQLLPPSHSPRPPRVGKLQHNLATRSVDPLDFMALHGCALQVNIGKRNSSLGRLAKPSQKLLLDLEYLRLAPTCIEHLTKLGKSTLADAVNKAGILKREQLPKTIFNATLGGEEFRAFWQARPTPGLYPPVASSEVLTALASLHQHTKRWLEDDYRADNQAFEILLSQVAGGDGGALLQSLARQRDWLDEANRMLSKRRKRGPLCAPGIRHDAADVLPKVVQKFFVGEIQPQAASMERRLYQLLPAIDALEQTLAAALPDRYQRWQTARNALLETARAAPANHVAHIKTLLDDCHHADMAPDNPLLGGT